jgi:hypothetical protein
MVNASGEIDLPNGDAAGAEATAMILDNAARTAHSQHLSIITQRHHQVLNDRIFSVPAGVRAERPGWAFRLPNRKSVGVLPKRRASPADPAPSSAHVA